MERILRQVLWSDDIDNPKQSLAAWEMLTKPKEKGGVGLVNFKKKNEALLMKYLDKFYNKADIPWVQLIWSSYFSDSVPHAEKHCGSFWWRDIAKLSDDFRQVSFVRPGNGKSIIFGWINGCSMEVMILCPQRFRDCFLMCFTLICLQLNFMIQGTKNLCFTCLSLSKLTMNFSNFLCK
jgi:hypothetical protein